MKIPFFDVSPVRANVANDPFCPGLFCQQRCKHRVRDVVSARLSYGGDVIHIDRKFHVPLHIKYFLFHYTHKNSLVLFFFFFCPDYLANPPHPYFKG
jgi:hypothetical protein